MASQRVNYICCVFLLFIVARNFCNSSRILGLFPYPGRSHFIIFEAIMKELIHRGHSVDVVSHFPQKTTIERYKDLSINGTIPILSFSVSAAEQFGSLKGPIYLIKNVGHSICSALFNSTIINDLFKTRVKYDLIITHIIATDCLLIMGHALNAPVVGVVTSYPVTWTTDRFGYPDNPSYIPNLNLHYKRNTMSLTDRLWNVFYYVSHKFCYEYYGNTFAQKLINEKFGENSPKIHDLQNNMSLLLVNAHFSLNDARPTPPNVIEVGGLHVKPQTNITLPNNLEKILNESKNGVIYFCLGSMVRTHTFPLEKQMALMEAFGQLPYTIIWKAEKSLFNIRIPNNIFFMSWTPQQELLCHPKIKLFINHGGSLGSQEAIYCGVPMIGIPFCYDQHLNVYTYQKHGVAKVLLYDDITTTNLLNTINLVLNNSSFKENVKFMSKFYQDRPQTAMNTAMYWIEYVIRYKGAPHLRPKSVGLPWYEYFLIDVALIVIGSVTVVLYLGHLLLRTILRYFINKISYKVKVD